MNLSTGLAVFLLLAHSVGHAAPPGCAAKPDCSLSPTTRCIVEAIPFGINGLISSADMDVTLINVSKADQEVILDVFANGAYGISNKFAAGIVSFPPTLSFDQCPGPVILGACLGGWRHGCSGNSNTNVYKLDGNESLHNTFHVEANTAVNPDIHSSLTVMIRVNGTAGAIRSVLTNSYAAPFVGVGTAGAAQMINHYPLNGGRPF